VLVLLGTLCLAGCPETGGSQQQRILPDRGLDGDVSVPVEDAEAGVVPDLGVPGTENGHCFDDEPRCDVGLACTDGRCLPAPSGELNAPCAQHLPNCIPHLRCIDGICRDQTGACEDTCAALGDQVCAGAERQVCAADIETGCLTLTDPIECDQGRTCEADLCVGPPGTTVYPRLSLMIDHPSVEAPLMEEIASTMADWGIEYLPAYEVNVGHFPAGGDCSAAGLTRVDEVPADLAAGILAPVMSPSAGRNLDVALFNSAHFLGRSNEVGVIVLVIGGGDRCGRGGAALRRARNLRGRGAHTLVMVVGPQTPDDVIELRQLAQAGGLSALSPDGFFPLQSGADLRAALDAVHAHFSIDCQDYDGDGRGPLCGPGPDCAPSDPTAWGEDAEICDGEDNDCDGRIDEAVVDAPLADLQGGPCAGQTKICVATEWEEPAYTLVEGYEQTHEVTCDGIDNDCDGTVDEDIIENFCNEGVGVCAQLGDIRCQWDAETQTANFLCDIVPIEPIDEICDEQDNDCDGETDEGVPPGTGYEFCNGIDEDCDGVRDESPDLSRCEGPENTIGGGCARGDCIFACDFNWKTRAGLVERGCGEPGYSDLALGNGYTCFLDEDRDQLTCVGDAPPHMPVDGPIVDFAAGPDRIVVLDREGRIHSWARPGAEPMETPEGDGFTRVEMGTYIGCALDGDGHPVCWGVGARTLPALGDGYIDFAVGGHHVCLIDAENRVSCHGNCLGQCFGQRVPPEGLRARQITAGYVHSCAVTLENEAVCWGAGRAPCVGDCEGVAFARGQSAVPQFNESAITITAGRYHTCTISPEFRIRCWGDDREEQVSDLPAERQFLHIWAGYDHTCTRLFDGWVQCWGNDEHGQQIGF